MVTDKETEKGLKHDDERGSTKPAVDFQNDKEKAMVLEGSSWEVGGDWWRTGQVANEGITGVFCLTVRDA